MRLFLRPDVHLATIDEDLVVLDVRSDAYFCLPGGAVGLALAEDRRSFEIPDADAEGWRATGLFRDLAPDLERALAAPPLPTRSLSQTEARIGLCDLLAFAGCLLDMAFGYRGRSFAEILRRARRGGDEPRPQAAPSEVHRLCRVFERLLVWSPVPAKCLARSFALLCFLRRRRADAVWVIAVRTWPFAAHCWLQLDDCALDDAPDRLIAYTPILAV